MATTRRMLGVGEVSRRSGLPVSTLHFYEQRGLIASERNAGNQRRYAPEVLRRLAVIRVAQRAGIPLDELRGSLGPCGSGARLDAAQWRKVSSGWRDSLDDRIEMLVRLRDELDRCVGCGCLSLADCPLRNPDDVLGRDGPGARILERPRQVRTNRGRRSGGDA